MIPEDTIAEIRSRIDIVALVNEYVPLKKAGVTFKGLCPFHNEKSASFNVHPKRRFFHCFGCQASGDVFAFMMRIDGSPFPEVARILAERAGIEIPNADPKEEAEHRRKKKLTDRLFALTDAAAGFFLKSLKQAEHSELARQAITDRNVTEATAERFRLGYAPSGWSGLVDFLTEAGWPLSDAEKLGLIVPRRGGGHYDRFRHRLMFPVSDVHGRIVAFSGRILPSVDPSEDADKEAAKYVNSPETPIYTKGSVLFGLHEARVPARRVSTMVVCEGNFDLLAISQAEVEHVVAPLGTAFTKEHARLLRRHVEKVVLLFDADAAGRKATRSAFPLLQGEGIATQVVTLPQGYDPDSFIRDKGAAALRSRVDAAKPIVDHLIDEARRDSVGDARATADAIENLGPVLAAIDNPVERRLSVERVAQKFGIADLDVVKKQLRRGLSSNRSKRRKREPLPNAPVVSRPPMKIDFDPMEEGVVAAMLEHPQLFSSSADLLLVIKEPSLLSLISVCRRLAEQDGVLDGAKLLAELAGNPAASWVEKRLVAAPRELAAAEHAVAVGFSSLVKKDLIRRAKRLSAECSEAFERGDEDVALDMSRRRALLQQLANQIRSAAPIEAAQRESYLSLTMAD